jgi:alkylation response protein AidB-like acyl-CoA dehydrogenase
VSPPTSGARGTARSTVDNLKTETSIPLPSGSLVHHPEVQHAVVDMAIELEGIGPQLDRIADDWSQGSITGARAR